LYVFDFGLTDGEYEPELSESISALKLPTAERASRGVLLGLEKVELDEVDDLSGILIGPHPRLNLESGLALDSEKISGVEPKSLSPEEPQVLLTSSRC